jgi:hypothetical protein
MLEALGPRHDLLGSKEETDSRESFRYGIPLRQPVNEDWG